MSKEPGENFIIPFPEDFENNRLTIDFGLRSISQKHKIAVVPCIGSVKFLRQITWSLAAIYLCKEHFSEEKRRELGITAVSVANALEAFASKAKFNYTPNAYKGELKFIRGIRAFNREKKSIKKNSVWTYKWLSQKKNYVQNTHRQETSAAIYELNLTEGSPRFNAMQLTSTGKNIANIFLQQKIGKQTLLMFLSSWIKQPEKLPFSKKNDLWKDIVFALDPEKMARQEKNLYKKIFNEQICYNGEQILLPLMSCSSSEKDLLEKVKKINREYYNEIMAAKRFEKLQLSIKELYCECIKLLDSGYCKLKTIEKKLNNHIKNVKCKGRTYLKYKDKSYGRKEVNALVNSKFKEMMRRIIADNESVSIEKDTLKKSTLFYKAKEIADDWTDEKVQSKIDPNWPFSRLKQWHDLCVDCGVCR